MSSRTIYSCDHCGKDVNKSELTPVHLTITLENEGTKRNPTFSREVCDDCLKEFGLVDDKSSKAYISNYVQAERSLFDIVRKFFTA